MVIVVLIVIFRPSRVATFNNNNIIIINESSSSTTSSEKGNRHWGRQSRTIIGACIAFLKYNALEYLCDDVTVVGCANDLILLITNFTH